ncbi:hypothetical protein NQZ79_g2077 [Umbelopsis isabellina]|nr:hypothetical protein NQZ79_g2077 [Umbelopsis isabellina]
MLPNSRKIPTVPSNKSSQSDSSPVLQDGQRSTTASSHQPSAVPSKSGSFFSRFSRKRSQSATAPTTAQLPNPAASTSALTSKTSTLPTINNSQPIDAKPYTSHTPLKVQRKPIGSDNTIKSAQRHNAGLDTPKKLVMPEPVSSASLGSSKPMTVKKKSSAVSLDPLRKLSHKLEKTGISSTLSSSKSTTNPPNVTKDPPTYPAPYSPVMTPPLSNSSSFNSDFLNTSQELKKSASLSRPLYQISEDKPEQKQSVNGNNLSSGRSSPQTTPLIEGHETDLRALGVKEKDLKAVQESLDRLSSGRSSKRTDSSSSLYKAFETGKDSTRSSVNEAEVDNQSEAAEPLSLADIVLQNTRARLNTKVVSDAEGRRLSRLEEYSVANNSQSAFNNGIAEETVENDEIVTESDSDDDSDEGETTEEAFVDATGVSQDDIEREQAERRLSKRLSGGHYGSAGGLLLSIAGQQMDKKHRESSTPSFSSVEKALAELEFRTSATEDLKLARTDMNQRNKAVPPVPPSKDRPMRDTFIEPEIVIEDISTPASEISDVDSVSQPVDDALREEAEVAAKKLWSEDANFVEKDAMTEWMGQPKLLNSLTLNYYMAMFDFSRMRLDTAFSKLYMKAESQQIDRILEVFAKRYWQCNKKSIFGSADVVYAVTYSLLLLNTDLHVVQGGHSRMTRSAFVRNTMSAAYAQGPGNDRNQGQQAKQFPKWWEAEMEIYLRELYYSIKQRQILQPKEHQLDNRPKSILDTSGVSAFKRSVNSMVRLSSRESMILNTPDANQPSPRPSISSLHRPTSPPNMRRRPSATSLASAGSHGSSPRTPASPYQTMMSLPGQNASCTSQPPFYKEGLVIRKHLLESADQKAKTRDWKECIIVVNRGELQVYSSTSVGGENNPRRSMLRASSASLVNLADSLKTGVAPVQPSILNGNAQIIESLSLNHSLSNALPPPGYNRQRPHVFALQLPNGGVYLFQAPSQEQVNEWVSTCNYWAARGSKEPLIGGVSNMEYGWGECLSDVILNLDAVENGDDDVGAACFSNPDQIVLYDWRPPVPPLVSCTLSETEQLASLQRQLATLTVDINAHREIKKKIEVKFPVRSTNNVKALTNWENRSRYLLHEIIKLQNYCDILERAQAIYDKEKNEIE